MIRIGICGGSEPCLEDGKNQKSYRDLWDI